MAIKLSGSVSRKVPIPGLDYSSQSYSAGMEIEINSADAAEVQAQLAQLYGSLSRGIDAQIATATTPSAAPVQYNGNGNGYVHAPLASHATPQPVQQPPAFATGRNRVATSSFKNGSSKSGSNGQPVLISAAQSRAILAICRNLNLSVPEILAEHSYTDLTHVPMRVASQIIDHLKNLQNGNGAAAQS